MSQNWILQHSGIGAPKGKWGAMDKYEAKPNLRTANFAGPAAATRSANHQLLLDRLTRQPAALAATVSAATPATQTARGLAKPEPRASADERRAAPRRRMLKGGVISYKGSYAGLRCTVRDLSYTGARVRIGDVIHVPDQFELIIEIDGLYAKSEVVWRKGHDLGVRFTEPLRSGNKLREQVITPRD